MQGDGDSMGAAGASRRARFAWCFFDWANSAFPTVIVTFVFSTYFVKSVADDEIAGTVQWGHAIALSSLAIALLSPVLGAVSDHAGPRKPWIALFTITAVCCAGLTWYVGPDAGFVLLALLLLVAGNTAFEMGMVFYNAMLVDLARPGDLGRLSGWGWGLGYLGGLSCVVFAYFAFINPDVPLFGLDKSEGALEHVRINGPVVAIWFAVFAVPLFLFTPDRRATGVRLGTAVRMGVKTLRTTILQVRRYGNIARFLLARLLYIDGLNTLFAFGAIYAASTFGLGTGEIFEFAIALNVTAGVGAILFGHVDDRIGSKRTIIIALLCMIGLGIPLLVVESKLTFWLLAVPLGLFMGPTQAASRSLMARLAPPELEGEMFGLFAFSGKVTAFFGPLAYAWAAGAFGSQRAGMATIFVFLVLGLILLLPVKEPGRGRDGR